MKQEHKKQFRTLVLETYIQNVISEEEALELLRVLEDENPESEKEEQK